MRKQLLLRFTPTMRSSTTRLTCHHVLKNFSVVFHVGISIFQFLLSDTLLLLIFCDSHAVTSMGECCGKMAVVSISPATTMANSTLIRIVIAATAAAAEAPLLLVLMLLLLLLLLYPDQNFLLTLVLLVMCCETLPSLIFEAVANGDLLQLGLH